MDSYDLRRFVQAQEPAYSNVLRELTSGRKTTHWMWFVFPQIDGLGSSPMARHYAISSLAEARAYLQHPLLGKRLNDCTGIVLNIQDRSVFDVFGFPDDRKFHSSMTLFREAGGAETLFARALERYFGSALDQRTLSLLGSK